MLYTIRVPDSTQAVEIEASTYQDAVGILADQLTPSESERLYKNVEADTKLEQWIDERAAIHGSHIKDAWNGSQGVELRGTLQAARERGASEFELETLADRAEMSSYRRASWSGHNEGDWGK